MPQLIESTTPDAQREVIRLALDEIAAEVGIALRDARLDFPVFLTVPSSGYSFATMACPLDPSDGDWASASAIVCRIIGQRLGDVRLRGRALQCAVANATIAATDVMADTESQEYRRQMSSGNEPVIFSLCGYAASILFAMGRFGYRPASVKVITHPFCLASGIWPRRVQNDRLIVVRRREWLGLVATSGRRRLIALRRRVALIARGRWRPVGIAVRAITVGRVGGTVGTPPSEIAKPNANKRFMDALLFQPSNNSMKKL
jgi:hypothetical protein